MILNITYDSSVSSAPSGFVSALNYVVTYLEATFTNPVTVNIDVGWGEVDGQQLSNGALGESMSNTVAGYSYNNIFNALTANPDKSSVDQTVVQSLPSVDPTHGSSFSISTADAKALGLIPSSGAAVDGWVGFDATPGTFNFDTSNQAVPGLYDFVGVAFHEITEVMGRTAGLFTNDYSVLDLFRYSAPGTPQLIAGHTAYFSIDGGVTNLDNFNRNPGGDYGDWAGSAGSDAFLAFSSSGVANAFSTTDLTEMDAIGWNTVVGPGSSPVTASLIQSYYQIILQTPDPISSATTVASEINTGQLTLSSYLSQLAVQAKDTTAAVEEISQIMSGHTLDAASLQSEVMTMTTLTQQFGTPTVGWNGIAASFADSPFAPQFAAKYSGLNGDAFIQAVTADVFGSPILNAGLQNSLNLYISFYAQYPDSSDPTGAIRGKGYFVGDMVHQASDGNFGPYPAAAQAFLVGLATGSHQYGDSLFG